MNKYAIVVQGNGSKVVGCLPLGKSENQTIFYFLKADRKHQRRNTVIQWKVMDCKYKILVTEI